MAQASNPPQTADQRLAKSERAKTSVVIPVYNEVENIPPLVEEISETLESDTLADYRPYEIIFVEDGSDDGTEDLVDQLAFEFDEICAVHLKRSWGQSTALAAGIDEAAGDIIITMDGDRQNDPHDIPWLLAELADGADCVSGWRKDRNDPWHKTIPSAIQTRLAKATGPDINDFGCTLTAYRAEAIDEVDLRGERHRYIPAVLHDLGYEIREVEVNHRPREHGESRYGVGRLIRGFVDLLYHVFRVRYSTRPMHIFGGLGLLIFGLGIGLGMLLVGQRYLAGIALNTMLPKLLLSVSMTLFGFGMLAVGLVTELLTELLYADERPYRIDEVIE